MRKLIVKCTIEVPIEVADDHYDDDFTAEFDIEENHCPGTGLVGAAIEKMIRDSDEGGYCWACPKGECEIIRDSKYSTI